MRKIIHFISYSLIGLQFLFALFFLLGTYALGSLGVHEACYALAMICFALGLVFFTLQIGYSLQYLVRRLRKGPEAEYKEKFPWVSFTVSLLVLFLSNMLYFLH